MTKLPDIDPVPSRVRPAGRRLARGLLTLALAAPAAALAVPSTAAAAPPGPCDVARDYGVFDSRHDAGHIGGTWYNCSSSATDHVKIEVNNASDSKCTAVAPGSGYISYDPSFWVAGLDHTRTWKRC